MARSRDEIRSLILRYLYDRNCTATSARGKKGSAVKIGDMRRDLKNLYGLNREEVLSNLRYLISQKWVEEQAHQRVVPINGKQIPSSTLYYIITAAGIDKIEGPGEYTPRDRFAGIVNITATQSTVTVGDGNQINSAFAPEGESLAVLAKAVKECVELSVEQKRDVICNIDTIQSQLARSKPDKGVLAAAWSSIEALTKIASITSAVTTAAEKLGHLLA